MKDSFATINYENRTYDIMCANPQQLSSTLMVLGRLVGLSGEFSQVINPLPTSIVDVGANVGAFSIMFDYTFPGTKIVAIEPGSTNIPYLTYNCKEIENIEVRQMAAGSIRRKAELALPNRDQKEFHNDYPESHTGCLSLYGKSDNMREEVDVFPLDDLELKRPIGLIKIDVEGHELHVLEGAKTIIEEDRPTMLIEVHEQNLVMAGTTKWNLFRKLSGLGYWPEWIYGSDYLFIYKGIDYFMDRLDYQFMEGTKRGFIK